MDRLKNHYNALAAGAIALPLGYLTKKALGVSSVSAKNVESMLASFVIVVGSVMAGNYAVKEMEKQ